MDLIPAIGFDMGKLILGVKHQEFIASGQLNQLAGRPAGINFFHVLCNRINDGKGRSKNAVDRRGPDRDIQFFIAGEQGQVKGMRQNAQIGDALQEAACL